jgi:hypothetical protein
MFNRLYAPGLDLQVISGCCKPYILGNILSKRSIATTTTIQYHCQHCQRYHATPSGDYNNLQSNKTFRNRIYARTKGKLRLMLLRSYMAWPKKPKIQDFITKVKISHYKKV